MLVTASPIQAFTAAANGFGAGETPAKSQRSAAPAEAATALSAADAGPAAESIILSLRQAAVAADAPAPIGLSPVFAEVWKDGLKVAEIDSHGSVTAHNGMVAAPAGGGAGGAWLAAARAAQIAQAVGGEIRVAGQAIDGPTLAMRQRLQATYSV